MEKKELKSNQKPHVIINHFKKRLKEKGLDSTINDYAELYVVKLLIKSYTYDRCYKMIDYYFNVSLTPSWVWFKNNADKIDRAMKAKEEDSRVRRILREQARDWLK